MMLLYGSYACVALVLAFRVVCWFLDRSGPR